MKDVKEPSVREVLETVHSNLADHQGCGMSIDLTQELMRMVWRCLGTLPAEPPICRFSSAHRCPATS